MIRIDWAEVPAGVLVRGTPVADVEALAEAHGDLGIAVDNSVKLTP